MIDFILKGSIVHSKNKDELEIVENGYVICKNGLSEGIFSSIPEEFKDFEIIDYSDKLIVPGFTDLHVHAPQYNFRSVGMDSELLDWLNQHAFPEESKL